jgi:crotonobetainyl-CoA:carnitine CoA-transferase CaiB-like acyl-CoA transferase
MTRLSRPNAEPPGSLRPGQGDHTTGITTCAAVLAALVERGRTGQGRLVETSLFQTGLYTLSMDLSTQATLGRLSSMKPREDHRAPMTNCYQAGDGRWFYLIGVEASRHFPALCRAIDRPDLAADERFESGAAIARHNKELIVLLDEIFATHDLDHWAARFDEHDVWYAPCQTPAEVVADPQAEALSVFQPTIDGDTTITTVASPVRFDGHTLPPSGPVPALGHHTDEVLAELRSDELR